MPAWCAYRQAAREEANAQDAAVMAESLAQRGIAGQRDASYDAAPLAVVGAHDEATVQQMRNCLQVGNTVAAVLCADGHLGYAQPVGGVVAYEGQISISGVGFDIACGNAAIRLDLKEDDIRPRLSDIGSEIARTISFGVGRVNDERVEHELFDDDELWRASGMADYKQKARAQLGTVGSGNHYVDVFADEEGHVWVGVHFGSRGLGHTSATRYLKLAGGKDGMHVAPTVVQEKGELGQRYLAAMRLAGNYAYVGRDWVVDRVRRIIGGSAIDHVHNHHNFAWLERHQGRDLWVVRKGATPAFPGQRGFVGGSMGDDAVILEGRAESAESARHLFSTVHGAGRLFGRKEAKRRFSRTEMDEWIRRRGVLVFGADLDESPMAYRRLEDVLAHHAESVAIKHRLRPLIVVMAGDNEIDPFKD